jgi:hypothetical protein
METGSSLQEQFSLAEFCLVEEQKGNVKKKGGWLPGA